MIGMKRIIGKLRALGRLWEKKTLSLKYAGAILIEFAFAIPVLVIVLYFGLDVPMAYRISTKLHKFSELYSQILLNSTKQRVAKLLTLADLKNTSRSVGLALTGIFQNTRYPFNLSTYVICVKGTGGNQFAIKWCVHIKNELNTGIISNDSTYTYSTVQSGHSGHGGNIKTLTIQKDEVKLLVETVAWYDSLNSRGFNNVFYLLAIPGKTISGAKTFGDRTAVITPYEGMISETTPPS
jgi:hypothetical protein